MKRFCFAALRTQEHYGVYFGKTSHCQPADKSQAHCRDQHHKRVIFLQLPRSREKTVEYYEFRYKTIQRRYSAYGHRTCEEKENKKTGLVHYSAHELYIACAEVVV